MATKKKRPATYYLKEEIVEGISKLTEESGMKKSEIVEKAITAYSQVQLEEMAKPTVITVGSHKGGVAKTTTAANLGVCLGHMGRKVLMIDLDGQANLSELLDVYDSEGVEPCIADVLITPKNRSREKLRSVITATTYKGVDLVPSSIRFDNADAQLRQEPGGGIDLRLQYAIEDLIQDTHYDYIIIDCPPSLGLTVTNAITALDAGNPKSFTIVPVSANGFSVRGLKNTLETIEQVARDRRAAPHPYYILETIVAETQVSYQAMKERLDEEFSEVPRFTTKIPNRAAVGTATFVPQPVVEFDSTNDASKAYRRLAREVDEMANGS